MSRAAPLLAVPLALALAACAQTQAPAPEPTVAVQNAAPPPLPPDPALGPNAGRGDQTPARGGAARPATAVPR